MYSPAGLTPRAIAQPRPAPDGTGVAGRLPGTLLLPLAAALAASAFLPTGAAWCCALAVVILLGVPHGALDGEVARPLLRPRFGRLWFGVFALPYLSLSAAVLVAWHLAPLPTLAAFLLASLWHFGEEDAGSADLLQLLFRGGLPIAAPVLLHPAATTAVLSTVALVPLDRMPPWLLGAAFAWLPVAALAVADLVHRRRHAVLAEAAGLLAAFAMLPPLTAFAFYFVAFHAPRHVAGLLADPALAPRLGSTRRAIKRALPVTALTLLLGAALWPLYPGPAPERLLALTLQSLAALTLPHLLLNHLAAPAARR